ncbi:transmembrane protein 45B-like [Tachypleus tridentatus]|uniref:transmembrane protein 45B-like n=1 Tax=Tachypleus tridentatus TaxID=6853 RepID=UPI003FD574EA
MIMTFQRYVHVLPGIFFFVFAFYRILHTAAFLQGNQKHQNRIRRWTFGYHRDLKEHGDHTSSRSIDEHESRGKMSLCVRIRSCPFEGILKIICASLGAVEELYAAIPGGHLENMVDLQHATVYGFFVLSGVVDILCHYRILFPEGTDLFVLSLAFGVEELYFILSLSQLTDIGKKMHVFLIVVITFCIISTLAEMKYPSHIPVRFFRSYFTMIQGTWFIQVGVLFKPVFGNFIGGSPLPTTNELWVSLIFMWHLAGCFIILSLLTAIIVCCKKRNKKCLKLVTICCSLNSSPEAEADRSKEETEPLHP